MNSANKKQPYYSFVCSTSFIVLRALESFIATSYDNGSADSIFLVVQSNNVFHHIYFLEFLHTYKMVFQNEFNIFDFFLLV